MTYETESWIRQAGSRETSVEIMTAIHCIAGGDSDEMERIWLDPTGPEVERIREIVTEGGEIDSDLYRWGAAGVNW